MFKCTLSKQEGIASVSGKLLEPIIRKSIFKHLGEERLLITASQHGFTRTSNAKPA